MDKKELLKKRFIDFIIGLSNNNDKLLNEVKTSNESKKIVQKWFMELGHVFSQEADQSWIEDNYRKVEKRILHKRLFKKIIQIAASFIGLLAISSVLYLTVLLNDNEEWVTVTIERGEIRHVVLPDSSSVHLAPSSVLSYSKDFGITNRRVKLDGQGFFSIRKNTQMPFMLTACSNNVILEVTGTVFDFKNYSNENISEIILIEGGVKLDFYSKGGSKILSKELMPLEKVQFDAQTECIVASKLKERCLPDWLSGCFVFVNEDLGYVANILERYYDMNIVFNSDDLQSIRINGSFKNNTIFEIIETISLLIPLEMQYDSKNKTIYISAAQE